jgi:50S ribosomal subunit-associated GTPase HflX
LCLSEKFDSASLRSLITALGLQDSIPEGVRGLGEKRKERDRASIPADLSQRKAEIHAKIEEDPEDIQAKVEEGSSASC